MARLTQFIDGKVLRSRRYVVRLMLVWCTPERRWTVMHRCTILSSMIAYIHSHGCVATLIIHRVLYWCWILQLRTSSVCADGHRCTHVHIRISRRNTRWSRIAGIPQWSWSLCWTQPSCSSYSYSRLNLVVRWPLRLNKVIWRTSWISWNQAIVGLECKLSVWSLHPASTSVVAFLEHIFTCWVEGPVVSFSLSAAFTSNFYEAFIQWQVMPNGVLPAFSVFLVKWKLFHDVLVDLTQCQPLLRRFPDSHSNECDIWIWRFYVRVFRLVFAFCFDTISRAWGSFVLLDFCLVVMHVVLFKRGWGHSACVWHRWSRSARVRSAAKYKLEILRVVLCLSGYETHDWSTNSLSLTCYKYPDITRTIV